MKKVHMQKKGFTLIELLVVISIIGLLSSVVLASLNTARAKARDAQRMTDLKQIQIAIEAYHSQNGVYPAITHNMSYDTNGTNGPIVVGGPSLSQQPGCGHVNRWCLLGDYLKEWFPNGLPNDPQGAISTRYYAYSSNTGNSNQTYGLSVTLEQSPLAANDGGFYANFFETGPQVSYCMNKYSGNDRNWLLKVTFSNVCYGGN
jgi:prepilin-type N-terminal cleavage/methylation domain-containing protein